MRILSPSGLLPKKNSMRRPKTKRKANWNKMRILKRSKKRRARRIRKKTRAKRSRPRMMRWAPAPRKRMIRR